MPRFFFHVRQDGDFTLDKKGFELAGLGEVRRKACEDARATAFSHEEGILERQFVITDQAGIIILTYAFSDALKSVKN